MMSVCASVRVRACVYVHILTLFEIRMLSEEAVLDWVMDSFPVSEIINVNNI